MCDICVRFLSANCTLFALVLGPEFVYEALRTDPVACPQAKGRTLRFLAVIIYSSSIVLLLLWISSRWTLIYGLVDYFYNFNCTLCS